MILIPVLGIILNNQKKDAYPVLEKVIAYLEKKGVQYYIEESVEPDSKVKVKDYQEIKEKADYIIIIGGDGTFLHTVRYFFGSGLPLLGINIGHLGFLTEIETGEIEYSLDQLLAGNYSIEKRLVLEARIENKGQTVYRQQALNDFVIHRGSSSRMVSVEMYINDEIVSTYRADGLIVSTPTGSTAYSLSAGGPIVNPQIRAIIVTPICPHSLFIKPMVISDQERIKIKVKGEQSVSFAADGASDYQVGSSDEIFIEAAKEELSIVKLPDRTFYSILHKKLKVGFL